jgi:hypothetical protein
MRTIDLCAIYMAAALRLVKRLQLNRAQII